MIGNGVQHSSLTCISGTLEGSRKVATTDVFFVSAISHISSPFYCTVGVCKTGPTRFVFRFCPSQGQ